MKLDISDIISIPLLVEIYSWVIYMQFKSFGIIVSCFFLLLLPVIDLTALPLQIDESKSFDAEHYTHSVQKSLVSL